MQWCPVIKAGPLVHSRQLRRCKKPSSACVPIVHVGAKGGCSKSEGARGGCRGHIHQAWGAKQQQVVGL